MLAQGEIDRAESQPHTRAMLISTVSSADPLRVGLEHSAFDVRHSRPGPHALAAAVQARPQAVLVDGRTNEADALLLCKSLRSMPELASALLIIINREDRDDLRAQAIEAGADEWFAEPSTSAELRRSLEAVKRRINEATPRGILRYADLELDLKRHRVRRDSAVIWLSSLQMRLLKFLMENPAVVFSRQELLEAVWGDKALDEGTVTVGMVRLRRALNSTGRPNLLRQVRGFGYALDADTDR
jgi:two-component system phosphate regulon response regulator PhoB